jgi:hypothetical protein
MKEIEKTLTSSQEMREEEEHTVHILTHWEKEVRILEDWLSNLGTKNTTRGMKLGRMKRNSS